MTAPAAKPVPFTVRVNAAPPGAAAVGFRGWLTCGMAFCAINCTGTTEARTTRMSAACKALRETVARRKGVAIVFFAVMTCIKLISTFIRLRRENQHSLGYLGSAIGQSRLGFTGENVAREIEPLWPILRLHKN